MKLISIGDNVVDCYLDQNNYYPGGNAINVLFNYKRNTGNDCAYIGVFGDDDMATHIKNCLENENIPYEKSRKVYAPTAQPKVKLVDNDRVFVGGIPNSAQRVVTLQLIDDDLEYIKNFDICFSSCYSSMENELYKIKSVIDKIAFDFSDKNDTEYLKKVCPFLTYAFFSGSDLSMTKIDSIFDLCYSLGVKYTCITLGDKGSILFDGNKKYTQQIIETQLIDTMGAGDSFIAGFLGSHIAGESIQDSLLNGAKKAANSCTYYGGIGYPHPL